MQLYYDNDDLDRALDRIFDSLAEDMSLIPDALMSVRRLFDREIAERMQSVWEQLDYVDDSLRYSELDALQRHLNELQDALDSATSNVEDAQSRIECLMNDLTREYDI